MVVTSDHFLQGDAERVFFQLNQPGYVRAIVARDEHATKVEWARDSAWRFMPTVRDERVGFLLHPVDLAVNKTLALAGRDEARDLLDTPHFHRDVLVLGALCWAAPGKDPGFTPLSLLELLRRRGRVTAEDLARLDLAAPVDLRELKQEWLAALDSVEPFVESRPAGEIGCLYYSPSRQAFVDPPRGRGRGPPFRPSRRGSALREGLLSRPRG